MERECEREREREHIIYSRAMSVTVDGQFISSLGSQIESISRFN